MALLTRWAWVWVDCGSWWWTGRPGVLWFMGSQRVGHDWATELNWTRLTWGVALFALLISSTYPTFLYFNAHYLNILYQKVVLVVIDISQKGVLKSKSLSLSLFFFYYACINLNFFPSVLYPHLSNNAATLIIQKAWKVKESNWETMHRKTQSMHATAKFKLYIVSF